MEIREILHRLDTIEEGLFFKSPEQKAQVAKDKEDFKKLELMVRPAVVKMALDRIWPNRDLPPKDDWIDPIQTNKLIEQFIFDKFGEYKAPLILDKFGPRLSALIFTIQIDVDKEMYELKKEYKKKLNDLSIDEASEEAKLSKLVRPVSPKCVLDVA